MVLFRDLATEDITLGGFTPKKNGPTDWSAIDFAMKSTKSPATFTGQELLDVEYAWIDAILSVKESPTSQLLDVSSSRKLLATAYYNDMTDEYSLFERNILTGKRFDSSEFRRTFVSEEEGRCMLDDGVNDLCRLVKSYTLGDGPQKPSWTTYVLTKGDQVGDAKWQILHRSSQEAEVRQNVLPARP